ncbi:putative leucine Rich Repeat family protein [Paratrimastix pyriformis]|uniref:Leucine Rich Repeat family protein n=1 Tax=Paratrimastix pyriformis TaxID=342808 RepID=A0ABQ8UN95_9EUKA|nr:putative leucine Rich Repeat family protein [Paratrimastix pyriformis]
MENSPSSLRNRHSPAPVPPHTPIFPSSDPTPTPAGHTVPVMASPTLCEQPPTEVFRFSLETLPAPLTQLIFVMVAPVPTQLQLRLVCRSWNLIWQATWFPFADFSSLAPLRPRVSDRALLTFVNRFRELRELNLAHCAMITDQTLVGLAPHMPCLRRLDASDCDGLTDASLVALGTHCPRLEEVVLVFCADLSDAGVEALARGCPALRSININSCVKVGNSSLATLAAFCPRLVALSANLCPALDDAGLTAVRSRALPPAASPSSLPPCLTAIELPSPLPAPPARCQFAQKRLGLEELSLAHDAAITDEGVAVLVSRCRQTLRRLDLAHLPLTDDGAIPISLHCTALRSLSLSHCNALTDVSMGLLLPRTGPTLVQLDLNGCTQLTDATGLAVARHCPRLEQLYLGGCKRLTDLTASALLLQCRALRALGLQGCRGISARWLAMAAATPPVLVPLPPATAPPQHAAPTPQQQQHTPAQPRDRDRPSSGRGPRGGQGRTASGDHRWGPGPRSSPLGTPG